MPEEIDPASTEEPPPSASADPGRSKDSPVPLSATVLNWRMVAWGGAISFLAVAASEITSLWWLVLLFGLLVPAILALRAYWSADRNDPPASHPQGREEELLGALGELGELTPTTAAMRTTLTVEEAAGMLEKLAKQGHLEARTQGAVVIYGLWGPDRRETIVLPGDDAPVVPERPGATEETRASVAPLVEPLTEREAEVLVLLASGRTNREIAADLFVTVGTIKAHTSNIYAKLQVRNRAEALSRARELGLLD